ncbi:hypothetical protein ILUMI_23860 [Ignelater luminosus]|uniref:3-dehydrosphinganine reductase n=1 Tax=Ignelater luminosus TaxID=2038154 RepID=A0A8K0CEJ7_IGNLU|nr:hypothetical protein ILUMI_23860 [Ignelater luminosus]
MVFFLFIPIILGCIIKKIFFPKTLKSIEDKHVVITGGSSGIGKSAAVLAAKQGAHVTIIARNQQNLNTAVTEIKQACTNTKQKIQSISLDVSDYKEVGEKLNDIEETVGPIYMLINCAGLAICGKLEDISNEDIQKLVHVNFLGTVYPTKAVVPKMKQRKEGIIVITASQAAMVGIFGLSAYSGSKFALRGFAEALDMELRHHNISVTVALPADTDTPGYETENKSKPVETAMISESGGLYDPNHVAKIILQDALEGNFFSYLGIEGFITSILCVGMSKCSSLLHLFLQAFLLGPFRIIACLYLASFNRTIKKCLTKEEKNK